MKVGEFTRKLKDAVNNEGYTCNNVDIIDISSNGNSLCYRIDCQGNDGQVFSIYVEED